MFELTGYHDINTDQSDQNVKEEYKYMETCLTESKPHSKTFKQTLVMQTGSVADSNFRENSEFGKLWVTGVETNILAQRFKDQQHSSSELFYAGKYLTSKGMVQDF